MKKLLLVMAVIVSSFVYSGWGQTTVVVGTNNTTATADMCAQVSASQFGRQLSIGTNWNILRVAMMWNLDSATTDLTSTPNWCFGVCSGTNSLPLDVAVTNFVGVWTTNTTWTYTPSYHTYNGIVFTPVSKVGSTLTRGTAISQTYSFHGANAATSRAFSFKQILFVTITKGSPNYTISTFGLNDTTHDIASNTLNDFFNRLPLGDPTDFGANTYFKGTNTVAASEAPGPLDTVAFGWDRAGTTVRIYDLAIVKLQ